MNPPGFWWFENLKVKVFPDGTMGGSSTADIKRLKTDLYSDVADDALFTARQIQYMVKDGSVLQIIN